jgi:APA family basic amino acid/polyamine antiporter
MKAAAVVMPIPAHSSGLSRTLETVLRERPCRVILETTPSHPRQRSTVAA